MIKRLIPALCLTLLLSACATFPNDTAAEPIDVPDVAASTSSDTTGGEAPAADSPGLPALADVVIDPPHGLGEVDGIAFLHPSAGGGGTRHIAVYQNYSSIVLTLPLESPALAVLSEGEDIAEVLTDLERRVDGLLLYPEEPEAVAIVAMPLDGYNDLMEDLKLRFAAAISESFSGAGAALQGFSVYNENFAAVRLYVSRDAYDDLTEEDLSLVDSWAAYCLAYQELLGAGPETQIPIYFGEAADSEPYASRHYPEQE